jgi:hypothetical protein
MANVPNECRNGGALSSQVNLLDGAANQILHLCTQLKLTGYAAVVLRQKAGEPGIGLVTRQQSVDECDAASQDFRRALRARARSTGRSSKFRNDFESPLRGLPGAVCNLG